jgi:hypothetical protein
LTPASTTCIRTSGDWAAGANYRGLTPGNPATYNVFTAAGHDNYPGVKVAGGHDFVGDAYNGSNR